MLIDRFETSFPRAQRFGLFTDDCSVRNLKLYMCLGSALQARIVHPSLRLTYLEKGPRLLQRHCIKAR
jgi:hypothetical protein